MALETLRSVGRSRGDDERGRLKRGMEKETGSSKRGEMILDQVVRLRRGMAQEKPRQIREIRHDVYNRYKQGFLADDVEKRVERQREKLMKSVAKYPDDSRIRQKVERKVERDIEYFLRAERDKELRRELRSLDRTRRQEFSREVKKLHKADRDARQAF